MVTTGIQGKKDDLSDYNGNLIKFSSKGISRAFFRLGRVKLADKPGSVVDSHSSRRTVTCTLKQPTRRLSEPLHRLPIWFCSGWRLPRFTVTKYARLCGPIPHLTVDGRYPSSCSMEPGLSSPHFLSLRNKRRLSSQLRFEYYH